MIILTTGSIPPFPRPPSRAHTLPRTYRVMSHQVARLFLGGGAPIVVTESRSEARDQPRAEGAPLTLRPLTVGD